MIIGYFLIFFARVVDVSMSTMRTLMVVQGRRVQAALIGFVEIAIYVTALGKVVNSLDNPLNLLAYSLGFASGTYIGITIEGRIALGNLAAQIIMKTADNEELIESLRENKFGVTIVQGVGIQGTKEILNVALKRKDLKKLQDVVYEYDEDAFITVNNINPISGGYFSSVKK